MFPKSFHITFVFPHEEVYLEVLEVQSLARVLVGVLQKVGLGALPSALPSGGWYLSGKLGKLQVQQILKEPKTMLKDVGLNRSCEILVDEE